MSSHSQKQTYNCNHKLTAFYTEVIPQVICKSVLRLDTTLFWWRAERLAIFYTLITQGQECLYGLPTQLHVLYFSSENILFIIRVLFKKNSNIDPLTIFKALAGGAWVAQSVERLTSAQVMISQSVSSSSASGSVLLTTQSLEPVSDSVSPSLCDLPRSCSVSVSKINKR